MGPGVPPCVPVIFRWNNFVIFGYDDFSQHFAGMFFESNHNSGCQKNISHQPTTRHAKNIRMIPRIESSIAKTKWLGSSHFWWTETHNHGRYSSIIWIIYILYCTWSSNPILKFPHLKGRSHKDTKDGLVFDLLTSPTQEISPKGWMTVWTCLPAWIFKAAIQKQEFISSTKIGHDQNIPAKPNVFFVFMIRKSQTKKHPTRKPF